MTYLIVNDFSCLKKVEFEGAPIVAVIGPQGSGKSVTTKLNYFCTEIVNSYTQSAERGDSFEEFKRTLANKFRNWFPPSAWGDKRFNINYTSGDFNVRILRRLKYNRPTDELAFNFSDWFVEFYDNSLDAFNRLKEKSLESDLFGGDQQGVTDNLEASFRLRDTLRVRIRRHLRDDFVQSQTFIPAGRAFFTSISRLVAGFDVIGNIDPITIRFAKFFSEVKERNARLSTSARVRRFSQEFRENQSSYSSQFFGGSVVFESETEYVVAEDGRVIPFSSLSSGQQEMIPIWTVLQYYAELDEIRRNSKLRPARQQIYIEEPEAHLFPTSQSEFLGYLIETLGIARGRRSLVLTTHSPYIMGRLNVFLKAGQLSRRKKKNTEINAVVPRERWIQQRDFRAYAMRDGHLHSILDEDGIIDTEYLDAISDDIVCDFEKLIDIEAEL